jgi:hypothetical protein
MPYERAAERYAGEDEVTRTGARSAFGAALVGAASGVLLGLSTPVVQAAPSGGTAGPGTLDVRLAAVSRVALPFIVFPSDARPGEVVHVRERDVGIVSEGTLIGFAFASDPAHRSYAVADALGHVRADLVVPPGTQWGRDPIVVSVGGQATGFAAVGDGSRVVGELPFVATRSAQPPLWTR